MQRSVLVATSIVLALTACYVEPAPTTASNPPPAAQPAPTTAQPAPTYAQPTSTTQPTYAPQPTTTYAPQPTATAAPQPTSTVATPAPTFPSPTPGALPPGLVIPNVCIPIGTWTKQFDNGLPASGTVQIAAPIMFNQFPVTDGVVVANAPIGTLRGTGAMTSTNDLSVDVSNGAILASYTCKFTGANCNQGTCTMTKGGVGGFKLVKR